jgi:hypothetical protein
VKTQERASSQKKTGCHSASRWLAVIVETSKEPVCLSSILGMQLRENRAQFPMERTFGPLPPAECSEEPALISELRFHDHRYTPTQETRNFSSGMPLMIGCPQKYSFPLRGQV